MNPRQLLLILRDRYKIALAVWILTIAIAMIGSELVPKQYTAETQVMVDIRSPDPISALLSPTGILPGSMGTQVDVIKSDRVARKVVRMLRLDQNPAVRQMWMDATEGKGKLEDWMGSLLQKGLKVTPSRDSNIISIAFQGRDPVFVTAIANAYAQAYVEASVELKVEPARQYALWFGDQAKVLRENVEKAQARLSEYQRKKGIVATEEAMDYEVAKLNDLSARLTAAQGETRDARSRERAGSGEVLQDSVVQGLRAKIADAEAKLKEAAVNFGLQHPQYKRMQLELAELKNRLEVESSHVRGGYSATGAVGRTKEADLQRAIEAQKRKVLDLKKARDEIAVLLRDVDTAKRAYEAVTNRYNQTSIEAQATRTNVSVLTPAIEPLEPSFPKSRGKTFLAAIILGIVFAGASVVGLETLDRRVRSADDLTEMLQTPVLAVIEPGRPPGRLAFRARALPLLK